MPTYEYLCMECGNRNEVVQSFTDDPLTTCEVCGGKLRKVIHPVGIQFKGSGFYSTDRRASQPVSRNNNQEKDSKTDSTSDSKSESKSEAKSETKAESKSDSSTKSDSGSTKTKTAEKSA